MSLSPDCKKRLCGKLFWMLIVMCARSQSMLLVYTYLSLRAFNQERGLMRIFSITFQLYRRWSCGCEEFIGWKITSIFRYSKGFSIYNYLPFQKFSTRKGLEVGDLSWYTGELGGRQKRFERSFRGREDWCTLGLLTLFRGEFNILRLRLLFFGGRGF